VLSRRRFLAASGAAIGGFAGPAVLTHLDRRPQHIVIILLDALRADRVGALRGGTSLTPAIDSLARRGLSFTRCYSASSHTKSSVASIFAGCYPAYHGLLMFDSRLSAGCDTIAKMLAANGWRTFAFLTNPWLARERDGIGGFAQGFELYDTIPPVMPHADGTRYYATGGDVLGRLRNIPLDSRDRNFLYIHLMDTHQPWLPCAETDESKADISLVHKALTACESMSAEEHRRMGEIYDGACAAADVAVDNILAHLARVLSPRRTLVVVTADHGDCLGEFGRYGHGEILPEVLIRVPLVMAGPGIPRGAISRMVTNAALYETVRYLVAPKDENREPILDSLLSQTGEYPVLAEVMPVTDKAITRHAVVWPDGRKAVVTCNAEGSVIEEDEFCLPDDPGESKPLPASRTDKLLTMRRRLRHLAMRDGVTADETSLPWQSRFTTHLMTAEEIALREQLRALGYLR
jgi:arylsulfatase